MTIELILPVPVERDAQGYWIHPALPDFGDEGEHARESYRKWKAEQRLELKVVEMELDCEDFDQHPYYEGSDHCLGWEPSQPEGEGWFCLSIVENDDGPICWWARRTAQEVSYG